MYSHHPNISQALSTRSSEHCRHARGTSWPSPLLLRGVMESEGPPDRLISVLLLLHVLGGRLSGATSCICVVTLHSTVPYRTVQYALMDQIQIDLHIMIEQTTARTHDVCMCDDQCIWEVCSTPYTRHCIKRQVWWAIREGSAWTACLGASTGRVSSRWRTSGQT